MVGVPSYLIGNGGYFGVGISGLRLSQVEHHEHSTRTVSGKTMTGTGTVMAA